MKKCFWIKLSALCAVCVLLFSMVSPILAAAADLSSDLSEDEIITTAPQLEEVIKASSYETESGGESKSAEIDGYINGLRIDQNVTLKDNYNYQNSVNGIVNNLKPVDVTGSILVTEPQKLADSEYFYESKQAQVFSAIGSQPCNEIYPGSILTFSQDNIYKGNYTNNVVPIARSSGKLHLDSPRSDLTIDDLTYNKNTAQPALKIKQAMYDKMRDTTRNYVIRIASATSPEQLAASLGITKGAMDQAIDTEQWDAIRRGEKQMTVVSVQQVISTLTLKNDLSHPSALFGSDVGMSDVTKLGDGCMLVRKVNYGRQYLLTAEFNLTCSPNEERIDLTDAVIQTFRGRSITDEGQQNALGISKYKVWEIGRISTAWERLTEWDDEPIHLTNFIKFLSANKSYTKGDQNPVPVSYEATVLGGSCSKNVTLNIEATEYNFKGRKGEQVVGLNFIDNANGSNTAHWIDSWGLDIDAFNQSNVIREKQYDIIDAHNVTIDIPAYQILFGYRFSLRNGKTHTPSVGGDAWIHSKSESGHRLYNGWGLKITDDEGDSLYVRSYSLSGTTIQLEQQIRTGTNRSRIDSTLNYNWLVTDESGNPLYSQCGDYWGVGWGSAECIWEYYPVYEYAGRNLEMMTDFGAGFSDPIILPEEVLLTYDEDALQEAVKNSPQLSEEVKALIDDGEMPVLQFNLRQDIQPDTEIKALFENQAKDYTIGQYMEIFLSMVMAEEKYDVTELGNAIELAVDIPEAMKEDDREYQILREYDGVVEPVKTWIGEDGKLHFMSDKFSTFAIAYRTVKGNDVAKVVKPAANTGIESTDSKLALILTFLSVALCLGGVWFSKNK